MKIDSSYVGMDSARSYTSATKKSASIVTAYAAENQGSDTFGSFQDLLNAGANEKEGSASASNILEGKDLMKTFQTSRNVSLAQQKESLQTIRERCVQFLIKWLYDNVATRRGHRSSLQEEGCEPLQMSSETSPLQQQETQLKQMQPTNIIQLQTNMRYYHVESESTSFSTQGTVRCADGREISFNLELSMSRSFEEYMETNEAVQFMKMTDPLVINLDGSIPALSDQKFEFDLDQDGVKETISQMSGGSGFLALDLNGDGVINDGSELFGTKSGDGFRDLAAYDEDGNGWIDENDAIFDKLLVWTKDEEGKDELYTLKESGVGAICLQKAQTDFSLNSLKDNHTNGQIRSTGIFLYENGNVGTMQQLDLAT